MAEVDTSSYNQKQTSPFDTLGKLTEIQNAANQNKLFQQQFQTNKAVSNIYKQAIAPDGTLDQGKLRNLLATDPEASYGLPQAYQASQEAQQRNIQNNTSQLANQQKHIEMTTGYLSQLMAKPHITDGDLIGVLSDAHIKGALTTDEMVQLYKLAPRDQRGDINQTAMREMLQHMNMQLMSPQERLNATQPAPVMVNNGQKQIPMRFPQMGAPSEAGPGVQMELPVGTQRYNPATQQMEFVGPSSGGNNPGGGGMAAAPPLGAAEAASVDAQAGANQGVALQSRSDQVPTNKALLGNLGSALDNFTPGPGQDWKSVAAKFANANSPFGNIFDPKKIASQEEFTKQATQLAQSQFQQLGGTGANAQLESAMHTSPNTELSKMGNRGIIALLKGNEDAIAVKNQAWQDYKAQHGPQSYGQFSTQFNKSYDPRVFQGQYLAPGERQKMIEGMNKDEKKTFVSSLRTALANGWINPYSGQ